MRLGDAHHRALRLHTLPPTSISLFKRTPPSLQWALLLKSLYASVCCSGGLGSSTLTDGAEQSALQWSTFLVWTSCGRKLYRVTRSVFEQFFWGGALHKRDTLTKWIKSLGRSCSSAFQRTLDYFTKVRFSYASLIVTLTVIFLNLQLNSEVPVCASCIISEKPSLCLKSFRCCVMDLNHTVNRLLC